MSEGALSKLSDVFTRRSLVGRLTAWFAFSSFALVAIATTSLYWSVTTQLRRAENQLLVDRVRTLRGVLRERELHIPELIEEVELEWPGGPSSHVYVRILDPSAQVLARTHGIDDRDLPGSAFPFPLARGRIAQSPVDRVEESGRAFHLYAVSMETGVANPPYIIFQIAIDATDHNALLAGYRRWMLSTLPIALLLAVMVGHLVANRGLQPIESFAATLRRIRSTTLYERLDPAGTPTELAALAKTSNEMLDGLEESFAKLSRFSADLAHELRTPINNLRGEVEVAISRERSREEYRSVLESCLEEVQRLSKLIDSLLFLARAEGAKVHAHREPLELGQELAAVAEFYEPFASEAGVSLSVDVRESLVANLDRGLFQSAVGNLVHNAISATPRGGHVAVRAERDDRDIRVEVRDNGRGIASVDLPRVFDRLYRADESRTGAGSSGGAGLGLAIVKSIAALHRGSASIRSIEGSGTTATLTFPADITTS